jgi:long-chain acyl-CoA synthetase
MSLGRLLADAAARVPDRPALVFEGRRWSYAELDALAEEAAPESRVVVLPLPNEPESIARFHGAVRRGSVVVPLNPLLSEREVEERRRPFEPRPGTAVVLHTSGTTGEPKRVELPGGLLRANAEALASALGLREDDVVFAAAPLSHVFGMTACMNATFAAGATLALARRFDAAAALETCAREGVSVVMGVPTMLAALLDASHASGIVPRLRLAHVGAAPPPPGLFEAFRERFGATVLEGYGMTEAGGVVAVNRAGRAAKPGSVGPAVEGIELRIADDGEVLVGVGGGWIESGDLGRLDEDGDLFLLDRKKDVILRGGYSVYPSQVEAALLAHPAVREAAVVGVPDDRLGEEVAALVVADGADAEELKAFARGRVAPPARSCGARSTGKGSAARAAPAARRRPRAGPSRLRAGRRGRRRPAARSAGRARRGARRPAAPSNPSSA